MTRKSLCAGWALILSLSLLSTSDVAAAQSRGIPASLESVEFIGMGAPDTPEERSQAYTNAKVVWHLSNGRSIVNDLRYEVLHFNTTTIDGVTAGALYDVDGNPLLDSNGIPYVAETPDANSLMKIPGARSSGPFSKTLYLLTHYEYDWFDSAGNDNYGLLPMTMNLATIEQDFWTGTLTTRSLKNVDMSGVKGLWIPCAGSLTPWDTHLGSEEYEPDARCAVEPTCASGAIGLDSMNLYLDPAGSTALANVYDYGLVPEVTVDRHGDASVLKHRALGRISRELVQIMPDRRTAYQGDDGTYNVLTMFVADRPADLSSGTLYAAKWLQTSAEDGGAADLIWIRLGHATDAELETLAATTTYSDIFDVALVPTAGFTTIKAGHSTGLVEHLRLKPGMETAAAFLETRRYAAYLGATTEFEKFEGVTVNEADGKVYVALTRMRSGMEDRPTDPANDIRIARLTAGAVYQIDLSEGQNDSTGSPIDSDFVGTHMSALVVGEDIPRDSVGNTAAVDRIANPDNIKFSEKMRTLFIGEDSGSHINNFLWAYNVDTGKLSRILSLPAGAESTGLQAIDNLNGYGYIMSNYQHAGEYSSNIDPDLRDQLDLLIDKSKAAVGYIAGLPGLK